MVGWEDGHLNQFTVQGRHYEVEYNRGRYRYAQAVGRGETRCVCEYLATKANY